MNKPFSDTTSYKSQTLLFAKQSTFLPFLNQFMQGTTLLSNAPSNNLGCFSRPPQRLPRQVVARQAAAPCNFNALKPVIATHGAYKHKQIHTVFRANMSDQKTRAQFAKKELQKIILQTVTTLNANVSVPVSHLTSPADHTLTSYEKPQSVWPVTKAARANVLVGYKQLRFCLLNHCGISTHKALGPQLRLQKPVNQQCALKKGSFTTIRNRCILTGRSTIVGKFRLSRISFRRLAHLALIPGLTKAVNR